MKKIALTLLLALGAFEFLCAEGRVLCKNEFERSLYESYSVLINVTALRVNQEREFPLVYLFCPMLADMGAEAETCISEPEESLNTLQQYYSFFNALADDFFSQYAKRIFEVVDNLRAAKVTEELSRIDLEVILNDLRGALQRRA